MNETTYTQSENIALRTMAGEYYLIVLDAGESKMFNLNGLGLWFWRQLEKSVTKAQLLKNMLAEYDVDSGTAAAEIDRFLAYLQERELIKNL
ncbi:MAG: PqqD family protein [Kiritimatiellia bacterium]